MSIFFARCPISTGHGGLFDFPFNYFCQLLMFIFIKNDNRLPKKEEGWNIIIFIENMF